MKSLKLPEQPKRNDHNETTGTKPPEPPNQPKENNRKYEKMGDGIGYTYDGKKNFGTSFYRSGQLLKVFLHSFKLYFDAFGGTVVSFACFGGPSHFVVVVVSF